MTLVDVKGSGALEGIYALNNYSGSYSNGVAVYIDDKILYGRITEYTGEYSIMVTDLGHVLQFDADYIYTDAFAAVMRYGESDTPDAYYDSLNSLPTVSVGTDGRSSKTNLDGGLTLFTSKIRFKTRLKIEIFGLSGEPCYSPRVAVTYTLDQ